MVKLNYIVICFECGKKIFQKIKCFRCFTVIVTEKTNILLRYLHQQWDKKVKPNDTMLTLNVTAIIFCLAFMPFFLSIRIQPKRESRIKQRGITLHLHGKYLEPTVGKWMRILSFSVLSVHTQQRLKRKDLRQAAHFLICCNLCPVIGTSTKFDHLFLVQLRKQLKSISFWFILLTNKQTNKSPAKPEPPWRRY